MKAHFKKVIKKLALVSCLVSSGCNTANADILETVFVGVVSLGVGSLAECAGKPIEKLIDTYHLRRHTKPKDVTKENEALWTSLQSAYDNKNTDYNAYRTARAS